MSRLWLLRHAAVLAPQGLCYGASDLPADAAATQEAALAQAARLPHGLCVAASPLQRCAQLAQALHALRPDLPPRADARLAEMDFGPWEGRPWSAIGRAAFDAWLADFADAPPGGRAGRAGGAPGAPPRQGETVRALMGRVGQAWDEWRASGADALWITHAGVMRAALLLARGVRLPARAGDWPDQSLPFGEALCLSVA